MIKHFIIMASSYSLGKRIALDYSEENSLSTKFIQSNLNYIIKKCGGNALISTHVIETDKDGWDKVVETDKFFEKVKLLETKEEFVEILIKDKYLNGLDVAKYILSRVPCTHLKLEKIVYMCYADYLCTTKKKLFNDKIYAYRLGPVIDSVYKKYKNRGRDYIEDNKIMYDETIKMLPIRSRIISSIDGIEKIASIDKTIDKYEKYSANELVKLTHKDKSPWSKTKNGHLLSDYIIINYHKYETI